MNEFKKIDDVLKYVKDGLRNGTMVPFSAEKFARIIARQGTVGEEVISWSSDENGNAIKEKVDSVEKDEKTGKPGWVVTKADENGNPIIDQNGHTNDWIISDSVFTKKYVLQSGSVYKPVGGVQVFVKITENISLFQWGSYQNIAKGGFINITNLEDIYGISERDFNDTYRIITTGESEKVKKL